MRRWQLAHLVATLIWVATAANLSYDSANPWTHFSVGRNCSLAKSPDDSEGRRAGEAEVEQIAQKFDVPVQKARENIGAFQRLLRDEVQDVRGWRDEYDRDPLLAAAHSAARDQEQNICDLAATLSLSTNEVADFQPRWLRESVEQPGFSMQKFRQMTQTRYQKLLDEDRRERRQRAISMFAGLSTIPPVAVWVIGCCVALACRKYGAVRVKTAAVYLGSTAAFFCLWLGADDDRVDPFSDGQWLLLGCALLAASAVTKWHVASRNA